MECGFCVSYTLEGWSTDFSLSSRTLKSLTLFSTILFLSFLWIFFFFYSFVRCIRISQYFYCFRKPKVSSPNPLWKERALKEKKSRMSFWLLGRLWLVTVTKAPPGEVSCPARKRAAPTLWFTCMAPCGQARLSQRPLPGSPWFALPFGSIRYSGYTKWRWLVLGSPGAPSALRFVEEGGWAWLGGGVGRVPLRRRRGLPRGSLATWLPPIYRPTGAGPVGSRDTRSRNEGVVLCVASWRLYHTCLAPNIGFVTHASPDKSLDCITKMLI